MQLIEKGRGGSRTRLGAQDGFTMITTMLTLFILGILGAAAIAAANGDINLTRYDQDGKEAYAAAEAGINDYLAHLQQDSDYWTRCAGEDATRPLGAGNAVNQQFTGAPPGTRKWRTVPNSDSRYSIELIPAPGKTSCDTNDPFGSMIDGDGNIRIRATGDSNATGSGNYKSVVASFRRSGFLDYIYFTDLENQDPVYLQKNLGDPIPPTRATTSNGTEIVGADDLYEFAADKCERHWWGTQAGGDGRSEMPVWHGQFQVSGTWYPTNGQDLRTDGNPSPYADLCTEITFASADKVSGPFHSNDDILVSGTPDFGRTTNKDRVEVANISSSDTGWRLSSASPIFHTASGKLATRAETLQLPPNNSQLEVQAGSTYTYTGPTTITLNGTANTMTVTNGSNTSTVAVPPKGVIHVKNSSCGLGYKPQTPTVIDPGCGVVKVQGTYNKDLTISAEDDIIVTEDLTRVATSNAVLGLVAKNFVRVWHPADRSNCGSGSTTPNNIQIDAAILSLNGSFTVDNYDCGDSLGTLTVNGAIAQQHRGIVGTSGGGTGYIKDYNYDDRLKYRSPPYFLDPVQASWRVLRENDQAGAR
jgi:type II secretory pathway pseudopilin PulG